MALRHLDKARRGPVAAAGAVIAGWQQGHLKGLRLNELTGEEALALERPAMSYVRDQLRQRLTRQVGRAYRRWLHPTSSGRRSGDSFLEAGHCGLRCAQRTPPSSPSAAS